MREAVCIVVFKDSLDGEMLGITRQSFLSAFPGYLSFPGGKIEKQDQTIDTELSSSFKHINFVHLNAIRREVLEEIGFDIKKLKVNQLDYLGQAMTPEFSPIRFQTHFFTLVIDSPPEMILEPGEIKEAQFKKAVDWLHLYKKSSCLVVAPTLKIIQYFSKRPEIDETREVLDLNLEYEPDSEVPYVEFLYGVYQLMPLSHTLPPANRTNCFFIRGDKNILIDPSPKDLAEKKKLINTVDKIGPIDMILITHQHTDHYQYSAELAQTWSAPLSMSEKCFEMIQKREGENYFQNVKIILYKDGDTLGEDFRGEKLRVYELPGHDCSQIGIAPCDLAWFLVGDLIQTAGSVVIPVAEGDMKDYYHSLTRVIGFNPHVILPSHGLPAGGVELLKKVLSHRKKREKQILKYLRQGKEIEEIYEEIYAAENLPVSFKSLALETIQSHMKHLSDLGEL